MEAFVVGTGLVGEITHDPRTGQVYGGQSVIANPDGKISAVAKNRDRRIIVIKIKN
jgi:predicted amidohydrolase